MLLEQTKNWREGNGVDIKISGTPKEIAAFVSALQRRKRGPVTLSLGIDGREMAKATLDQLKILGARGDMPEEAGPCDESRPG